MQVFSMLRSVLLFALSYALCVHCAAHLSVKLSGGEDQKVTATISNDGDEDLKILHHPLTIFTTFPTDTFKFTAKIKESTPPRFKGIQIKYSPQAAIAAGAYTYLGPGQSLSVEHDLAKAYDFSESSEATYHIEANNIFYLIGHDGSVQTLYADVIGTELQVPVLAVDHNNERLLSKRTSFVGCSSARQAVINTAATQALAYASESYNYLASHTSATPRYTTWFGPYNETRHNLITSHFKSIVANTPNHIYDCTCTEDAYGYVYPDNYPTVYLCSVFWTLPLLGFDGQAGFIFRLSTQFIQNGGATDQVYGQTACKSLAAAQPLRALSNVDNLEYFAINDPPLA